VKLFTRTVGSGSRTAALIHGASANGEYWRDFTPYLLEHDLRLILVDQRGHGDSPRASSYRIEDFVDDLVDTLPVGLDLLIGQSLGGLTGAWASERLQPKRYIGIDPALALTPFSAWLIPTIGPIQKKLPHFVLHALGMPPKGSAPDTFERTMASWQKWDETSLKDIRSSYLARPFPAAPPAVPSTIVLADKSFAVRAEFAEKLRAAGWDVRVMKGGHDLHLENPARLAEILSDVLEPATEPA
jgi:pimeloyl-ACP methyl ester carboxylesterase